MYNQTPSLFPLCSIALYIYIYYYYYYYIYTTYTTLTLIINDLQRQYSTQILHFATHKCHYSTQITT